MKEADKRSARRPLVLHEQELTLKPDAWDIFYGRQGTPNVQPLGNEAIELPTGKNLPLDKDAPSEEQIAREHKRTVQNNIAVKNPPNSLGDTIENYATVANNATVELNSTVAKSAELGAYFATVEQRAPVRQANYATVANNATVEYCATVALSASVKFYDYWFRYSVIGHWIEDHLVPQLMPITASIYRRLFRLSYGFRENQGYCEVGLTALAKSCNISKRKVQDVIIELEKRGCIKRVQIFNEGPDGKRGTRYQVLIPAIALKTLDEIENKFNRGNTVANRATVEHTATVAQYATVEQAATNINDDDDDLMDNNYHHHRERTKKAYVKATGNRWNKNDDDAYQKIKDIKIETIEQGIQVAKQRATSRPNSMNYFIKEILALANPSEQSRSQLKKHLTKIIDQVREAYVGSYPPLTVPDLEEKVMQKCEREGVYFDKKVFNEIIERQN